MRKTMERKAASLHETRKAELSHNRQPEQQAPGARPGQLSTQPERAFVRFLPPHSLVRSLEPTTEERCDAVQNRQRILAAARDLFAETGVEPVTMTDIALAAGVGKGTLYRRFPHKGSLCQALMDDNTRAFQAEVLSGFGEVGRTLTPLGRLLLFLERLITFNEVNGELLKATYEAEMAQGHAIRYSNRVYEWQRLTMSIYLRACIASGECRPDLDIDYLADALLAPTEIELYLYQRQVLGLSPQRISAGLRQLLYGIITASTF